VEAAEIHAAGCISPGRIPTIPQRRIPASFHLPIQQYSDFLTEQIIDTQSDLRGFGKLNPDSRKCVPLAELFQFEKDDPEKTNAEQILRNLIEGRDVGEIAFIADISRFILSKLEGKSS